MKKKVLLLLLTLGIVVLALCGCSSDKDNSAFEKKQAEIEQQMKDYTSNNLERYRGMSEAERNLEKEEIEKLRKSGTISEEVATMNSQMIDDWSEIESDLGKFAGFGEFNFEQAGKTYTATLTVKYENRDTHLIYVLSKKDMSVTGANVEKVYSLGEKMSKAGLNTLMGIGIVFIMLVLMSLVIYSFRVINFIQFKHEKTRKEAKENKVKESLDELETNSKSIQAAKGGKDLTDDLELVAVITAAIAAATETSTDDFVVRSIRRRR